VPTSFVDVGVFGLTFGLAVVGVVADLVGVFADSTDVGVVVVVKGGGGVIIMTGVEEGPDRQPDWWRSLLGQPKVPLQFTHVSFVW
jgi:hypothetical protein